MQGDDGSKAGGSIVREDHALVIVERRMIEHAAVGCF
jgi:hypothetical protein